MSKKNLKLIMELIFIFILPLIFMCFTSEIQVEREFAYDNNGNYETSQETKNLSFDNSIIKYKKNELELDNSLDLSYSVVDGYYLSSITISNLPDTIYIPIDIENNGNYVYSSMLQIYSFNMDELTNYGLYIDSGELLLGLFDFDNSMLGSLDFLRIKDSYDSIENGYYKYTNLNKTYTVNIALYELLDSRPDINNNTYIKPNTIWGNIKKIVIDYLDVNDNVLLDILLCYLFLWFFMFLIWHTFYRFFDWIFHLSFTGGKDNG